ncbi:predicted protein [Nematostella vectensis]|uniref:EH domain-containing protein n=1 Tax=Nematostella vectensis TaxID=45351 RepID=A7RW68_NEMVE|nr:predicted protein [Nematostella vectensis]|eukprot:XP_001636276.1 predicted protein [Nematostella vectensis]
MAFNNRFPASNANPNSYQNPHGESSFGSQQGPYPHGAQSGMQGVGQGRYSYMQPNQQTTQRFQEGFPQGGFPQGYQVVHQQNPQVQQSYQQQQQRMLQEQQKLAEANQKKQAEARKKQEFEAQQRKLQAFSRSSGKKQVPGDLAHLIGPLAQKGGPGSSSVAKQLSSEASVFSRPGVSSFNKNQSKQAQATHLYGAAGQAAQPCQVPQQQSHPYSSMLQMHPYGMPIQASQQTIPLSGDNFGNFKQVNLPANDGFSDFQEATPSMSASQGTWSMTPQTQPSMWQRTSASNTATVSSTLFQQQTGGSGHTSAWPYAHPGSGNASEPTPQQENNRPGNFSSWPNPSKTPALPGIAPSDALKGTVGPGNVGTWSGVPSQSGPQFMGMPEGHQAGEQRLRTDSMSSVSSTSSLGGAAGIMPGIPGQMAYPGTSQGMMPSGGPQTVPEEPAEPRELTPKDIYGVNPPHWCTESTNLPCIYSEVAEKATADGSLDTNRLYPILLASGLPKDVLGKIWMQVNRESPGQLSLLELKMMLGLIALGQTGIKHERLTLEKLATCQTAPIPSFPEDALKDKDSGWSFSDGNQQNAPKEPSQEQTSQLPSDPSDKYSVFKTAGDRQMESNENFKDWSHMVRLGSQAVQNMVPGFHGNMPPGIPSVIQSNNAPGFQGNMPGLTPTGLNGNMSSITSGSINATDDDDFGDFQSDNNSEFSDFQGSGSRVDADFGVPNSALPSGFVTTSSFPSSNMVTTISKGASGLSAGPGVSSTSAPSNNHDQPIPAIPSLMSSTLTSSISTTSTGMPPASLSTPTPFFTHPGFSTKPVTTSPTSLSDQLKLFASSSTSSVSTSASSKPAALPSSAASNDDDFADFMEAEPVKSSVSSITTESFAKTGLNEVSNEAKVSGVTAFPRIKMPYLSAGSDQESSNEANKVQKQPGPVGPATDKSKDKYDFLRDLDSGLSVFSLPQASQKSHDSMGEFETSQPADSKVGDADDFGNFIGDNGNRDGKDFNAFSLSEATGANKPHPANSNNDDFGDFGGFLTAETKADMVTKTDSSNNDFGDFSSLQMSGVGTSVDKDKIHHATSSAKPAAFFEASTFMGSTLTAPDTKPNIHNFAASGHSSKDQFANFETAQSTSFGELNKFELHPSAREDLTPAQDDLSFNAAPSSDTNSEFGQFDNFKPSNTPSDSSLANTEQSKPQSTEDFSGFMTSSSQEDFSASSRSEVPEGGTEMTQRSLGLHGNSHDAEHNMISAVPLDSAERYKVFSTESEEVDKHAHMWGRCLNSCLLTLGTGALAVQRMQDPTIRQEILQSKQGIDYFTAVVEVYTVTQRLKATINQAASNNLKLQDILEEIDRTWKSIANFLSGSSIDTSVVDFSTHRLTCEEDKLLACGQHYMLFTEDTKPAKVDYSISIIES